MTQHTATPWELNKWGHVLAHGKPLLVNGIAVPNGIHPDIKEAKSNAEFIVRACNSHDDLLAALEAIVESSEIGTAAILDPLVVQARSAIAKAKGE